MADTHVTRRGFVLAAFVLASLAAAPPASAQHRARLSADLADALAAGAPAIDVIVHGDKAAVDATAARYNINVKRYLKSGAVFRVTAGQLAALQQDETYDHLSSDVRIDSSDATTDTIEADRVWEGAGSLGRITGTGVGVAVIDSGVDFTHAALKNRIAVSVDFTGGDGADQYGHGTHVAAIIAGQRGLAGDTSDYRGVAPGARIINLRVLGADGSGTASSVIEAIDWAIDNRARYNIRVINLSLGAPVLQPYRDDPLCEAAERAVAAGIVVVAAAGNFGSTNDGKLVYGSIISPGNDPSVLTVGALDTHATADRGDDTLAPYTSRGPTMYDLVMKPDLVAPGSHIVSAEAPGSYLATKYPERYVAGSGEDGYMQLSGTSMAAAVATGAVALLLDEKPMLSPNDVKVALQVTSTLMPDAGLLASGAGSLDVFAAAEFLDGAFRAAFAEPPGSALPTLSGSFSGQSGVHAQDVVNIVASSTRARRITFGTTAFRGESIVWGKTVVGGRTFVWGRRPSKRQSSGTQGVTFGQSDNGSIVWGSSADHDTIVWGSSTDADTIVWGSSADQDTIVWGSSADGDTIVWGSSADQDTIVWGSSADGDTIVWGSSADQDTIVWGSSADQDTIVWGSSADGDTIVWGSSADQDTIVWGSTTAAQQ